MTFAQLAGLRILPYLDDFLFCARPEEADVHRTFATWLLPFLGWIANEDKSDWSTSTTKESLGFVVDSSSMRLKVPADKIIFISGEITKALATTQVQLERLHSIWGMIQALYPALQGASAFCYEVGRQVVAETDKGLEGSDMISLSEAVKSELIMLRSHIQLYGPIGLPIPSLHQQEVMLSDAGEFGYGGASTRQEAGSPFCPAIGADRVLQHQEGTVRPA